MQAMTSDDDNPGRRPARRFVRAAVAALAIASAALASCGGGGDLIDPFTPTRQLSFGDETSVIEADGRNWGVNGLNADNVFDCTLNPNWVQYLAIRFGFVFAQCNPENVATPQATLYATAGAKVADTVAQIESHLATSGFGPDDMVTVLVGANDILEQYALYPASDEATITAELQQRGRIAADQVNRIALLDGRVIVATVPDLGLTPFAVAEEAATAGRAALLSRLTAAFNARMRANLINDGRLIGLLLGDEMTQAIVRFPPTFGFADVRQSACATAPPACTSATLVSGANAFSWLWADPTRLSAGGQLRLGQIAEQRARNNPF